MGNDLHASETELPVLPQTPLRLADAAAIFAPAAATTTAPRPITISPPSSLSTAGALQTMRGESTSHLPRTLPIASPSADMSTPPSGLPPVPSALPSLETLPTLPTLPTLSTAAVTVPLVEPALMDVVHAVVEQEEARFINAGPQHPMAHLMPERLKPTAAQLRATEVRSSKRKKARRTKVLVVLAVVATGVFAGPPVASWIVDAVNESDTTTDRPEPNSMVTENYTDG